MKTLSLKKYISPVSLKKLTLCGIYFQFVLSSLHGQITITFQATSPLCGGFATGSLLAVPSGGTPPYSYLWSNGATSNPITNLPAGTYTVTVTGTGGTTGTASKTLTAPPVLNVTLTVTNCNIPGAVSSQVTGGVPPYSYLWSTGATTPNISNLSPGQYCVTVEDNNDCAYSICKSIGNQMGLQVNTTNVVCGNPSGGSASASPTGGVTPYTYLWNTGATTQSITNLTAGTYIVTVTSDNGCTASIGGAVNLVPGNFNISLNVNHPTCQGTATGSIQANVANGAAPFTYAWSNGSTASSINNLTAGSYNLTVTDNLGCTSVQSASLSYQSNLSITINSQAPTCSYSTNGFASVSATNGPSPYTYLWSNGEKTQTIGSLGAGTYSVTVTDNIGCTKTGSVTLNAPAVFTVSVSATNATNCGAANGSVKATPNGSSPPYSYLWNNGATGNNPSNLHAGVYTVTVTSAVGCTATGSATIQEPKTLNVSVTASPLVCGNASNGTATTNVTYGTLPYTYNWSNGASTPNLSNLPAGNYAVTVTSSQGCTGTASATISGSPQIVASFDVVPVKCFGTTTGKITANTTGGTPPLSYMWNTGSTATQLTNVIAGNYSLTITDDLGCSIVNNVEVTQPAALSIHFSSSGGSCGDGGYVTAIVGGGTSPYTYKWNNNDTTQTTGNLPPGSYKVTVTDKNGCTASSSHVLDTFPEIDLKLVVTPTTCNGTTDGTATATVSGGKAPFKIKWNTNDTIAALVNLSPGVYSVVVTDANECIATASGEVKLGDGLLVSVDATVYVCPGETGYAAAKVFGGTPPYSYAWSNGMMTDSISNLIVGNYVVQVEDALGCSGFASALLLSGGNYNANWSAQNALCFGTNTGTASISMNGGKPPYSYLWSTGDTIPILDSLLAGNYAITVSDSTGCTRTLDVEVGEPKLLEVNITGFNGPCGGLGATTSTVTGGISPYSLLWSNGETNASQSNLQPGTYYLTATDNNGCEAVDSVVIINLPQPTCFIELTQPISEPTAADGELTVNVEGGNAPFSYLWTNGQTTATASNLLPGNYLVNVTDANNCQTSCTFVLYAPAQVGDFTWVDADVDGIQDGNEAGLEGVTVAVAGTTIYGLPFSDTTVSGVNGKYVHNLIPGEYNFTFTPPPGYSLSPPNKGIDKTLDSDANQFTGMTAQVKLKPGEIRLDIDAGFYVTPPCNNVTNAGGICCDQSLCGPGNDPEPFASTAEAAGGSGNLQYIWMFHTEPVPFDPNTWSPILSATGASYDPGPLPQTTYFVRVARREGCLESAATNVVTVFVDDVAYAEITGNDTTCLGIPLDFSAANNGDGAAYTWTFSEAEPAAANTPDVTGVTWNSFGLKTVTLQVTKDGCTSTDQLNVSISNNPAYCGEALIIDANPAGSASVVVDWFYMETDTVNRRYEVEWAWENDEFAFIGEPDTFFHESSFLHFYYTHPTAKRGRNFYRVKLTDSNGALLYSNIAEVWLTGDFNLVHVYPNPFTSVLSVEIIDRFNSPVSFELVTLEGKIVERFNAPEDGFRRTIPVENMPAGVYFLKVNYDGKLQKIYKLVKVR